MNKLTQLITIGLVASILCGCYNKGQLKTMIQNGYDEARAITKAKGDFCLYLGAVKFPYTDEPVLEDDIQWTVWNKDDLSKTLPLFAEIGLLTREPVAGQPGIYHYDLTELGREYQHMFTDPNDGDPIYNNAFCYGLIKIKRVTDVTEREVRYSGGFGASNSLKKTEVDVDLDYQVLDIPDWALNAQEKLNALYTQTEVRLPNEVYPDTLTFVKGNDGQLYQNVLSYKLIKP